MPSFDLHGKTILLTGAARGLGRELATLLDQKGCSLCLVDRDAEALALVADQLTCPHQVLVCDLGSQAERTRLIQTVKQHARIDVLINCAGIGSHSRLEQLTVEEVESVLQVNALAPLELITALAPLQLVVNIGSVAGEMNLPSMSLYAASKSALHAFTRSIRLEGTRTLLAIFGPLRGTDFVSSIRHPHTGQPRWYRDLDLDAKVAAQAILDAISRGRDQIVLPRWYPLVFALSGLFLPFAKHLRPPPDPRNHPP
jgi:short-subunit dehydrogenase